MSVRVQNLALRRGDRRLVEGLNFSLAPGEALAVTGDNGIGKTTLLTTLAGLTPADAGTMDLPKRRALLTDSRTDRGLSVRQSLQFWADVFGGDASTTIAHIGLRDRADQIVATLSAGQAKRLGMGRLLLARATLWLLDEPLAALDARARHWVLGQISAHLSNGGIVVWVTHRAEVPDAVALKRLHMSAPSLELAT